MKNFLKKKTTIRVSKCTSKRHRVGGGRHLSILSKPRLWRYVVADLVADVGFTRYAVTLTLLYWILDDFLIILKAFLFD